MNEEEMKQAMKAISKLSYEDFKQISEMLDLGGPEEEMKTTYGMLQSMVKGETK